MTLSGTPSRLRFVAKPRRKACHPYHGNRAYYANAKWFVNRQEAVRLYKAQVPNNAARRIRGQLSG